MACAGKPFPCWLTTDHWPVFRHRLSFVIRRLDRRIQREGKTIPNVEDLIPAGWIRRLNRRMTQ